MIEVFSIFIGIILSIIGIGYLLKAKKQIQINNNFINLKYKELDNWYQASHEVKRSTTQGIETWIQVLNKQADNLDSLVSELAEQKESSTDRNTQFYKDIVRYHRMNKEALKNTEQNIDKLEDWYFANYGRHYMMNTYTQYFTHQSNTTSKN